MPGEPTEISDEEVGRLQAASEAVALKHKVGCGCAWCFSVPALVAALRATRARLAAAERIVSAVREASQHDVDCEEEGEGRCCYEAWRRVTVLAGCAVNITADDERIVAHPEPEEAP